MPSPYVKKCVKQTPQQQTREIALHQTGKTPAAISQNERTNERRRRRRVKPTRAPSRRRTETTEKAFPETKIYRSSHDARRRFQDGGRRTRCQPSFLGVSTRTRYFPFSRDESNASLAERFAASSSLRRRCHSADFARFWRRHARGAVRGVLLEQWTVLFAVQQPNSPICLEIQLQPEPQ